MVTGTDDHCILILCGNAFGPVITSTVLNILFTVGKTIANHYSFASEKTVG